MLFVSEFNCLSGLFLMCLVCALSGFPDDSKFKRCNQDRHPIAKVDKQLLLICYRLFFN